jgi:hypothetical protein
VLIECSGENVGLPDSFHAHHVPLDEHLRVEARPFRAYTLQGLILLNDGGIELSSLDLFGSGQVDRALVFDISSATGNTFISRAVLKWHTLDVILSDRQTDV